MNPKVKIFRALSCAILAGAGTSLHAVPIVSALRDGPLGLHDSSGLKITNGKCGDCASTPQALWYFDNELVAAPVAQTAVADFSRTAPAQRDIAEFLATNPPLDAQPPLIWLGSSSVIPYARLSSDGKTLALENGGRLDLHVVPKIESNLSYYNADSVAWLAERPLRLRGEAEKSSFVARTIWPLDFSITPDAGVMPMQNGENLQQLVRARQGGAQDKFSSRLLWEKAPGAARKPDNKAALGIMLNGAQGDDDEAHGGHFAIATGRYRQDGDWSRWLVYNFYGLDSFSEKGIIGAPTPMDKYLFDLNNGQNWYRPSYMLVAVLKDDRTALQYQAGIERLYNHYYRRDFEYHHSAANCAGISIDTLRTLGWKVPERGHVPWLKAFGAYVYVAATSRSLDDARKIYDYLMEESTRLYPAVSFGALGEDLLDIVQGRTTRPLTEYEKALADDVVAIYYVHIPQIPSSRAFGQAPVYSFDEYMDRTPADRSDWKVVPTEPRPFPAELRDGLALKQPAPAWMPAPVAAALTFLLGLFVVFGLMLKRRFSFRSRQRQTSA